MKMRLLVTVMMGLTATALAQQPALAQSGVEARVGKLEGEMRAVQRKVFPGGSAQSFEPQIAPDRTIPQAGPGTPASDPVIDLTARVNALEQQMGGFTGQLEQAQNRLRLIEDAFNAYKASNDSRLKMLEGAAPLPDAAAAVTPPAVGGPVTRPPLAPVVRPTVAGARDPARAAQVAAVERPVTSDAGDDAYIYGFRLWQAKLYPEAEAQFKTVVATYPKHKRASYAQNMLGRTYLDDSKPSLASIAFYDNYKKMPDGERAPDSLFYLGQALVKLGKPADACKVYGELGDVYGAKIGAEMKANIARGRAEAKCG